VLINFNYEYKFFNIPGYCFLPTGNESVNRFGESYAAIDIIDPNWGAIKCITKQGWYENVI
jgi:uncharacterized protein YbdZ (MbtH family)